MKKKLLIGLITLTLLGGLWESIKNWFYPITANARPGEEPPIRVKGGD